MSTRVLREKNFRYLWIGQTVSQFGDALYALIFLFMVSKITGRADMVGFVGAIQAIPYLVLSPIAGVIADRMDRKLIMVLSDVLSTGLLVAFSVFLVFDPSPPVAVIFVLAGLLSTVNVFFAPAKSAAIPRLVRGEQLLEANSLSQISQTMMPMLGLALSASILGAIESQFPNHFFQAAILINAATFVYSAFCLARLPKIIPDRTEAPKHPMSDMRDGFRYVFRRRVLWVTILLSSLVSLLAAPFMVVYIQANEEWFGGHFQNLAWFEFGFMAGMLVGAITVSRMKIKMPGLGFVFGIALCGAFIAAMAFSRSFWLFFAWNIVCGFALPFANIPISTAIQLITPDEYRGRVNSASTMMVMAATPLGMGMAGILTDRLGLVTMFLIMGIGLVFVGFAGMLSKDFREIRLPDGSSAESKNPEKEEEPAPEGELLAPRSEN